MFLALFYVPLPPMAFETSIVHILTFLKLISMPANFHISHIFGFPLSRIPLFLMEELEGGGGAVSGGLSGFGGGSGGLAI